MCDETEKNGTDTGAREDGSEIQDIMSETPGDIPAADVDGAENADASTIYAGEKTKRRKGGYFTATRIAYIAVFTALSYVLYLFDFSVLPGVPFLKLDFSNIFVMISGFALGPVSGVIVAVLKELIHALTLGQTAFIGELANVLMVLPYVLIPSVIYRNHRSLRTVVWTLAVAVVAQCMVSIPVNYLLSFPAFYLAFMGSWTEGMSFYLEVWYWALLFNLIKGVAISAVVLIIYRPMSALIKATNDRFLKISKKRSGR